MALLTLWHAEQYTQGAWHTLGAYFSKAEAQARLDSLPGFCGMRQPVRIRRVRV